MRKTPYAMGVLTKVDKGPARPRDQRGVRPLRACRWYGCPCPQRTRSSQGIPRPAIVHGIHGSALRVSNGNTLKCSFTDIYHTMVCAAVDVRLALALYHTIPYARLSGQVHCTHVHYYRVHSLCVGLQPAVPLGPGNPKTLINAMGSPQFARLRSAKMCPLPLATGPLATGPLSCPPPASVGNWGGAH